MAPTPFYVAGRPESSDDVLPVTHPGDGRDIGATTYATPEQVEEAVAKGATARTETAHQRAAALDHVSRCLEEQRNEIALPAMSPPHNRVLTYEGQLRDAMAHQMSCFVFDHSG